MSVARVVAINVALALSCVMISASPVGAGPVRHTSAVPGYWLVGWDGGVFAYNAPFEGSAAPQAGSPGLCPFAFGPTINISAASLANSSNVVSYINCVGIAAAGANAGYWVANFASLPSAFGTATTPEQLGCSGLDGASGGWNGIAPTSTGRGFFLAAENGGVVGCGDATPLGGVESLPLVGSIVGIASTPDGRGYWLTASDGGVFAFGDANFYGSMGGKPLNDFIVGMAASPTGRGYWLVAADGGVFGFGDATFSGSMGGQRLNREITGMAANPDGPGYWLVAADGGIFAFGGAPFEGSLGGTPLHAPIVGMAATPN